MTTNEKIKLIGKGAILNPGTVDAAKVSITDIRTSFGRDDAFVTNPLTGKGAWRALDLIKVLDTP